MKWIASAALLLLLTFPILGATQRQVTRTSIQGTILTLQPKSNSFDVVVGVGMSLRLVRITVLPPPRTVAGRAQAPLEGLQRGDIVRVQFHVAGKQLVADRIEEVPKP